MSNQNVNMRLFFERRQRLAPIEVGRDVVRQDVVGRDGGVDVPHADDAIGLRHGQGPQQHGVDHRKDRGVGAQADGERQDDGGAEAWMLDEQPDARVNVADDPAVSVSRIRFSAARSGPRERARWAFAGEAAPVRRRAARR